MRLTQTFLDGRVILYPGDCLDVIKTLADNSIDSCVTDPPYALVSIVNRFGKTSNEDDTQTSDRTRKGADGYARLVKGFMGKSWDNGAVAFAGEFWEQVYRVLKPGAHVVAFGGTRSYHRLACAIEDAGFEVRDQLGWTYGSGFPKSHDVSKGIDKAAGATRETIAVGAPVKRMIAGADQHKDGWEKSNGREYVPTETAPATADAVQWQGWGTALKPAWEPICLARKPLSEGTVAANVLRWGTGALNIDGCRVGYENDGNNAATNPLFRLQNGYRHAGNDDSGSSSYSLKNGSADPSTAHIKGRWPANIIHDGSAEVIAMFPNSESSRSDIEAGRRLWHGAGLPSHTGVYGFNDSGSAARFFYSAKADADDRLGSKHPTVKPVDLMQWLCRLVTPKGGMVLDCFAGTGTTGAAAYLEGLRAILIERELEYQEDIARRMILMLAGPAERKRESIKARGTTADAGPLFAGLIASGASD